MSIVFYLLYVAFAKAHFSWLWLSIAIVATIYSLIRREAVQDRMDRVIEELNNNHWKGPYA